MPLLLPWLLAWSIERWDMLVAGEEWKDGSASPGVVAVIGEMLFAVVDGIVLTLWKKKGPWFSALAVLCPYCCGERPDQESLAPHVYPALPVCDSGEEPPFMPIGDAWRGIAVPSATERPSSGVSMVCLLHHEKETATNYDRRCHRSHTTRQW